VTWFRVDDGFYDDEASSQVSGTIGAAPEAVGTGYEGLAPPLASPRGVLPTW
jgi:hypothetical protein